MLLRFSSKIICLGKLWSAICLYFTYSNCDRIICSIELSEFALQFENKFDKDTLLNHNELLGTPLRGYPCERFFFLYYWSHNKTFKIKVIENEGLESFHSCFFFVGLIVLGLWGKKHVFRPIFESLFLLQYICQALCFWLVYRLYGQ